MHILHYQCRKLVSADQKSNTANYKHNFAVEIAPICKDDLVILPRKLAMNLSNISSVVLVKGVAAGIHVLDPFTCERQEVSSEKYWRHQFTPVMTFKDLTRFVVLSVDPIYVAEDRPSAKRRTKASRMQLAECVVVREKDLGAPIHISSRCAFLIQS
jgi:nonsense-mediated mRNA decay protein 3